MQGQWGPAKGGFVQNQWGAPKGGPPTNQWGPPQGKGGPRPFNGPPPGAIQPGRVFLTKMSPGINKDDLSAYFQQFGKLNDVYQPPGKLIAFIGYEDPVVAEAVVQMGTHEVKTNAFVTAEAAVSRGTQGPPAPGGFAQPGGGKGFGKPRFNPY